MERRPVLLILHGRLEDGLMLVGIELLPLLAGVKSLEPVLLQRLQENVFRHLQAGVQIDQVLVLGHELVGRHIDQRAVEVVDRVQQVFGEALKGKVSGGLDLAFGLFLQVAVFCDLSF